MAKNNQPRGTRERAAERRVKAFELRKAGANYRQIAHACGMSVYTAHHDVWQTLQDLGKQEQKHAEDVRKLEIERLDSLMRGAWARAQSGDDKSIRSVLGIMERRARLLGLDAPVKLDATVETTTLLYNCDISQFPKPDA